MHQPLRARQLAFELAHAESFSRDDFVAGPSNSEALAAVERWPDWPASALVLVGPEGAGKSHLAAIWAENAGARFLSARALAHTNLPAALATGALVVEDIAHDAFDERALFHLLNLARETEASLLLTARHPDALKPALPDLASRLKAIPTVRLAAPDDALLRAVLMKLFADRQIPADEALIAFLAARIERSVAAARAAVVRLDAEALRLHRPAGRALAAELFRADG